MDKHDFKKLDIERAQMTVSVQAARDLVTQWMGPDFAEFEEDAPAMPTTLSSTAGFGFKQPVPAAGPENKALGKLQRLHKDKSTPSNGKTGAPASSKASEPEESDTESKASIKRPKRTMTAMDAYRLSKKKKK